MEYASATIRCPFFRRKWGKSITCESFAPDSGVQITFGTNEGLDEHMENFCRSDCWQGCPIAQAAGEKY